MLSKLHKSYGRLFNIPDDEDQGDSDEGEAEVSHTDRKGYEGYGAFNYVMTAVEVANTSLEQVLEMPIAIVLYLVCWKIDKTKFEEEQLKKWKATH